MPKSFGVTFLAGLAFWAMFALFADRALGNHVQCGDVIAQDTTLESNLVVEPADPASKMCPGLVQDRWNRAGRRSAHVRRSDRARKQRGFRPWGVILRCERQAADERDRDP